ncbi:MAG: Bro-N domain-containing protein, partial [Methylomonas sp.]
LSFQDTQFNVIDRNQQPWLRSSQIAMALGYKDQDSISRIFARNQDEFTDSMTCTVNLTVQGDQARDIRIFSLRGCHLLAMFARTAVAKDFRKWVLDVLDRETQFPEPKTQKALPNGLTLEMQDCVKSLVKERVGVLPKDKQGAAAVKCWLSIKKKFGKTYKEVEPEHFSSIISLLGRLPLEGELLPKEETATNTSLTITLAPLKPGEIMKRWLITQHGDDMVQMWAVKPDTEVKQRDHFIRDLKTDGYLVIKKDEFSIGNFVMEQVPYTFLPVLIETAGKRLRAIDR